MVRACTATGHARKGSVRVLALRDVRLRVSRVLGQSFGLAAHVYSELTGSTYARFLGLRAVAERALARGDYDAAVSLARELLALSERYRSDWFYGNAFYYGHLALGEVAFLRGDTDTACRALLTAASTPGSPQLNSFGPNMRLAKLLLEAGHDSVVVEFLEKCRSFWTQPAVGRSGTVGAHEHLDEWIRIIRSGGTPDFGPNLAY